MKPCQWCDGDTACPRNAAPDADYCIWHNPHIDKSQPYVREVLEKDMQRWELSGEGIQLAGIIWPNAQLQGAKWADAELKDAVLPRADLTASDLSGSSLLRANLAGATLARADLSGCDLRFTNLRNADLRDANLRGCSMDHTTLLGTDLRGADLTGATIKGFDWNGYTRFEGVIGFDQAPGQGGEDDETRPYLAPLAVGDGVTRRHSASGEFDESLERSRSYTAGRVHSADDLPAPAASAGLSMQGPGPQTTPPPAAGLYGPASGGKRTLRKHNRMLATVLIVALIWALAGSALSLYLHLNTTAGTNIAGPLKPQLDPQPNIVENTADNAQIYQRRIKALKDQVARLQNELRTTEDGFTTGQEKINRLSAELSRRLDIVEDNEALLLERDALRKRAVTLAMQNRRLEETAAILAEGSDRLKTDNDRLETQLSERFAALEETTRFEALVKTLEKDVEKLETQLASTTTHRDRLANELARTQSDLERFLTRIEGTRLETLIAGEDDRGPLLKITPNEVLALGANGLLLTLRFEPGAEPNRVTMRMVVQREDHAALPDISVILYAEDGRAMRRIGFSFPSKETNQRFATATTTIDAAQFPSSVRVSAAAGFDGKMTAVK